MARQITRTTTREAHQAHPEDATVVTATNLGVIAALLTVVFLITGQATALVPAAAVAVLAVLVALLQGSIDPRAIAIRR